MGMFHVEQFPGDMIDSVIKKILNCSTWNNLSPKSILKEHIMMKMFHVEHHLLVDLYCKVIILIKRHQNNAIKRNSHYDRKFVPRGTFEE